MVTVAGCNQNHVFIKVRNQEIVMLVRWFLIPIFFFLETILEPVKLVPPVKLVSVNIHKVIYSHPQIYTLVTVLSITKTCPCNIYPLEPHFYIEKLGFKGVYLFFLFLLQNIDCGYSLEPPRLGGSNVYPQSIF